MLKLMEFGLVRIKKTISVSSSLFSFCEKYKFSSILLIKKCRINGLRDEIERVEVKSLFGNSVCGSCVGSKICNRRACGGSLINEDSK